jgi:hypothetical protein
MMILMNGIGQRLIFRAQPVVEAPSLKLQAPSLKPGPRSNFLFDFLEYPIYKKNVYSGWHINKSPM